MRRAARLALCIGLAAASPAEADPLPFEFRPIEAFSILGAEPERDLQFLGGLHVTSAHPEFGGFSGVLVKDEDGLLLLNDAGSYVRARLVHADGKLVGMVDAEIVGLFPGELSKSRGDTEDIALDPADPQRGVIVRERQANAMLSFRLEDDVPTHFEPMTVGADNRVLRSNAGLESVDYAPATSPAAGQIIAIAERPPRGQATIPGWIAGLGGFAIVQRDGYDVSSARFLPNGDLLLLERLFSPSRGIGVRLRRIPGNNLAVGAELDGDIILDAGITSQIDNMEGLAVSSDAAGRTILTLVSDDNYNAFQRTLILQFALAED